MLGASKFYFEYTDYESKATAQVHKSMTLLFHNCFFLRSIPLRFPSSLYQTYKGVGLVIWSSVIIYSHCYKLRCSFVTSHSQLHTLFGFNSSSHFHITLQCLGINSAPPTPSWASTTMKQCKKNLVTSMTDWSKAMYDQNTWPSHVFFVVLPPLWSSRKKWVTSLKGTVLDLLLGFND